MSHAPDSDPTAVDDVDAGSVRTLLSKVMHDPRRLPETLATFGVGRLGPGAARKVQEQRAAHPDWDLHQRKVEVLRRGMRTVVPKGALIGGPLLALAPYGFCSALLAQNKIVLELGTLAGHDPNAPERAAELLVLQDAYPDLETARAALADARSAAAPEPMGKIRALWKVTWRMAYLLGLTSRRQEDERVDPWWLHVLRWLLMGITFVIGMVVPLVWMPYLADSYRQSTTRITQRAERFYFGTVTKVHHTEPDRASRGLALVSLMITAGLVLMTLLVGVQIFNRTWVAVVVALAVGSIAGSGIGAVVMRRRVRRG